MRLTPILVFALCAALPGLPAAAAEHVVCHVTYGGQTQRVRAQAVTRPYAVAPVSFGSYFLFRIVFERQPAKLAAVKLYTYAARDEGVVPIHVAEFPYPAGGARRPLRFHRHAARLRAGARRRAGVLVRDGQEGA